MCVCERESVCVRVLREEGHLHVVCLFKFIEMPTKFFMVCVCERVCNFVCVYVGVPV